jgi:hypothetical protein
VSAGATADEGAKQLGEQLDAQHYTTAWSSCASARLQQTSPSARAMAPRTRDTSAVSRRTSGAVDVTLDEQSNGQRLGTALGCRCRHRTGARECRWRYATGTKVDQRSMNTALWQATWGYFLTNMIGMEGTG